MLSFLGVNEILPHMGEVQPRLAEAVCPKHPHVCRAFYALFVGMSPGELGGSDSEDPEVGAKVVTNYLSHMPSGASLRQIVHYAQFFRNGGRFSRYAKTYIVLKKYFYKNNSKSGTITDAWATFSATAPPSLPSTTSQRFGSPSASTWGRRTPSGRRRTRKSWYFKIETVTTQQIRMIFFLQRFRN